MAKQAVISAGPGEMMTRKTFADVDHPELLGRSPSEAEQLAEDGVI